MSTLLQAGIPSSMAAILSLSLPSSAAIIHMQGLGMSFAEPQAWHEAPVNKD